MHRLLVVIESQDSAPEIINKAKQLAAPLQASLHLYRCAYDVINELHAYVGFDDYQAVKEKILEHDRQWLSDLAAEHDASSHVTWHKRQYQGVVEEAQRENVDMIIKAANSHGRLPQIIHTPDDWHLMREAPCPVLLARPQHRDTEQPRVVAAVNALEDDDAHHALHVRVLDQATAMAKALGAQLQVVNAVPLVLDYYPAMTAGGAYSEYQEQLLNQARTQLNELLTHYGLAADEVVVDFGSASDVLSACCEDPEVSLLVVGTVANKGLTGALLGNTAEQILSEVVTNVLVVK